MIDSVFYLLINVAEKFILIEGLSKLLLTGSCLYFCERLNRSFMHHELISYIPPFIEISTGPNLLNCYTHRALKL